MQDSAISYELKLTDLISALVDWVDNQMPGALHYGSMPLKGCLERYFYFSTMHNPSHLLPLLYAAAGWRLSAPESFLTEFYDEMLSASKNTSQLSSAKALLKTVLRACKFLYRRKRPQPPASQISRIGLFAINGRFVRVFSEYAAELGKENILFFCANAETAEVASSLGFPVAMETPESIAPSKIQLSFLHPLFPAYWVALQNYLQLHGTIVRYRPSLMSFAEGTSMEDHIAALAARLQGVPTVRLQSGRGGIMHSGYRNMAFDKMLCWGEAFKKHYQQYSPMPEYIVTGSPLMNDLKVTIQSQTDNHFDKITILTQPLNVYINEHEYQELVRLAEKLATTPHLKVIVRKHPVDKSTVFETLAQKYPSIQLMPHTRYSLAEVLSQSLCTVGFYSTTLSESAACGVIPIMIKLKDEYSVFPHPERHQAALVASNMNEAYALILDIVRTPHNFMALKENMRLFSEKFFGDHSNQAMDSILTIIKDTAGIK